MRNNEFLSLDVNQVDLGIYAIHVVAGVLKMFFRTLPSPLITSEVYDEFLRACGEFTKWCMQKNFQCSFSWCIQYVPFISAIRARPCTHFVSVI